MRKRLIATIAASLALAALTCCGATSSVTNGQPTAASPPAEETRSLETLASYVELERSGMPSELAQWPGLYSESTVNGSVREQDGSRGIPAGTYSVVTFSHTYANEMDWSATIDTLDGQRSAIDDCFAALPSFPR